MVRKLFYGGGSCVSRCTGYIYSGAGASSPGWGAFFTPTRGIAFAFAGSASVGRYIAPALVGGFPVPRPWTGHTPLFFSASAAEPRQLDAAAPALPPYGGVHQRRAGGAACGTGPPVRHPGDTRGSSSDPLVQVLPPSPHRTMTPCPTTSPKVVGRWLGGVADHPLPRH